MLEIAIDFEVKILLDERINLKNEKWFYLFRIACVQIYSNANLVY